MTMRQETIHIDDLRLSNAPQVISVSVEYNKRAGGIVLAFRPVRRSKGITMMLMFGGPKSKGVLLEPLGRFSEKRLAEIAADIAANGKDSDLYGDAYEETLSYVLEANKYVLASRDYATGEYVDAYASPEFEVGQAVTYNSKIGYVFDKREKDDETVYDLVFRRPDGNTSLIVEYFTHRNISVEGHVDAECVRAAEGVESISADAVADLVAKAQAESERVDREREEAKRSTESAIEAEIAATKAEFPWAKQDGTPWARGSANLKTQLQMAFPSVVFSVKSDSYSMGNSISVKWTDGPSEKQVSEIADQYQYSTYNYHADIIESRKHGQGFRTWMGQAKYVSSQREISAAAKAAVEAAAVERFGEEAIGWGHYNSSGRILSRSEIYTTDFEGFETVEDSATDVRAVFRKPSIPPVAAGANVGAWPPSTSNGSVTVRENSEKCGVEIKFAAKPEPSVLSDLKAHGFRWSKFQKLWYAKANERTRAFAYDLAGSEAPAEYQAVQAFDTAVEDSMAAVCFA